ncbi:MAG: metallophosphoesterase [Calditrichaeota bacterium]|nr:MAG: metallophosphoesterase [Calditrichota bacterium]
MPERIALIGGVYSNYLALEKAIADAHRRGAEAIYCLGDLGAFGPHPDRVFPILREHNVQVVQGNYDHSIGNHLEDCQCGYTDPRDNYFAQISYDYTYRNTSEENKRWLKQLPPQIRLQMGKYRVLLCHGSPRKMNEFLWESTTPTHFLSKLCRDYQADILCVTHTGIHWQRELPGDRYFANVGVIGRPENDGNTHVGYMLLEVTDRPRFTYIPIEYDYRRLAAEMREEGLPEEFVETILTGWWTTCLEILPAKERKRGKF